MENPSPYRIFISHSGDDIWVAEQLAKCLEECGAQTFLDRRDIHVGDDFKAKIRKEIPTCNELVALFTPWSLKRHWVRHEIGMADALDIRIVCIFYHVSLSDFDADEDGRGPLSDLDVIDLNVVGNYISQVKDRVEAKN